MEWESGASVRREEPPRSAAAKSSESTGGGAPMVRTAWEQLLEGVGSPATLGVAGGMVRSGVHDGTTAATVMRAGGRVGG